MKKVSLVILTSSDEGYFKLSASPQSAWQEHLEKTEVT